MRSGYSVIGLDVGEMSAKMVQLKARRNGNWQLHEVARAGYRVNGGDNGAEQRAQIVGNALRSMLAGGRFVGRQAATVLPRTDVLIRPVKLPMEIDASDAKEVWQAIQREARRYLPYPPEEAVLDFLTVGKVRDEEAEKLEVLLMSAREDTVNEHISLLKAAGLQCSCIDIVPCAVLRTAEHVVGDDPDTAIATVEIGSSATVVSISRAGQLLFSRSMHTGGAMVTDAIAEALGLAPEKAETFKRNHGIDHRMKVNVDFSKDARIPSKDMPGVIFELCQEDLKRLSHEIKRSVNYFVTQFHEVKIERALLFGGGASLKGLSEFLADETGLRVDIGDPFVSVAAGNGAIDERISKDRGSFAVALGLALREG